MRAIGHFFAAAASIILILCILLTCVDVVAFDTAHYKEQYALLGVPNATDMQLDELMRVTERLLGYIRGKEKSLDFAAEFGSGSRTVFDEREQAHMVDVRKLYMSVMTLRNLGVAASALLLLLSLLFFRRDRLLGLAKSYLAGAFITAILLGAVGLYAYTDFYTFWTLFHRLFFTNDLWLLDPNVSVMINMFPQQFFFDMVIRILTVFGATALGMAVICIIYLIYKRIRRARYIEFLK